MRFMDLFFKKNACAHVNAAVNMPEGYCPDCGAYVKKYYYIVRCSCCEVKREARIYFGDILPREKYCTNCGSNEFYVEKMDKISFIDIQYAIHVKEVIEVPQSAYAKAQIWVDNIKPAPVKYLSSAG